VFKNPLFATKEIFQTRPKLCAYSVKNNVLSQLILYQLTTAEIKKAGKTYNKHLTIIGQSPALPQSTDSYPHRD